ncbi:MAG TPA: VWA domain-containing protein [Pyrinomonadaceae bacterium]|nr:VWA domain-containing protein [Pyrinomonadaceae bacterium]
MAVLIQVNGNNSGEGFLIAPDGARTFPVAVGLRTDDGTNVSATLQIAAGGVAGISFAATSIDISSTEVFVDIHATSSSTSRNDTVLEVVVGGVVQASFDLTAISKPEVWFKGIFEARFATDDDPYNEPRGTSGGNAFALDGEPDFVPADSVPDTIDKPVGRVIRFHNSPVNRSHVRELGVRVFVIKGKVGEIGGMGGTSEEFVVGDAVIGLPVNLGPNSYFAENSPRPAGNPATADPPVGAGQSPIGLFEFHISNVFSGTSAPASHRPRGFGIAGFADAEDLSTFNENRRVALQAEFDLLSPAQQAAQVGQNLTTRLNKLAALGVGGQFGWPVQVTYRGHIDSGIDFQPSNSSVLSYLAGYDSFTFIGSFANFHLDELRGQVEGNIFADLAFDATPLQKGIYNIQSREASPFNALTIPAMTTAAIDAALGGSPTSEKCVVTVSDDLDRLVVSKATLANPADPPATWTISSIGESLVGEFLPEASVLPRELVYRILQPGAQGSALGLCEGTAFDPPPQIGFAKLFAEETIWQLQLHAGTNGADGVTYKGSWSGNTQTLATGCIPLDVELLTSTINFGNVEQGMRMNRQIVLLNRSTAEVQIALPGLSLPFEAVSIAPVTLPPGEIGFLLISFVAGAPGVSSQTISLTATPALTVGLVVSLTGNSIAPTKVDAVLVLDRSFSMTEPGVNTPGRFMSKAQLRNEAAKVFIQMLRETDRIGIVRFNEDAQVHFPFQEAGPETGGVGTGRFDASASLDLAALNPAGNTSIGDGMFEGNEMLTAPGSTADKHALVVLTDGKENRDRFIAAVSLGASVRAYAIGLGVPQGINVAKLSAVTGNTGGYLLVTGGPEENEFRLHKYYAQILAGIHGNSVVLDPPGVINAGQTQRTPFYITEADVNFDVALLTRYPMLRFTLEAPDGTRIDPTNVGSFNGQFVTGPVCYYYRMHLPVFASDFSRALGKWHIVIEYLGAPQYFGAKALKMRIANEGQRKGRQPSFTRNLNTAVNYHILVTARSSIQLETRIEQRGFEPGLDRSVVAFLRASGQPLADRVNLLAQVTRPDGVVSLLPMAHMGNGRFEAKLDDAKMLGHYSIVVRAAGQTPGNFPLQREQTLSGVVLDPAADSLTDTTVNQITELLEGQQGAIKELAKLLTNLFDNLRDNNQAGLNAGEVLRKWLLWILIILIVIFLLMFVMFLLSSPWAST